MEPSTIIEMSDVAVSSPQEPDAAQIEGVNWSVESGQFWIVGGLHGSGKSNLLATAAGLQNPLSGTVKLFCREATELREKDIQSERHRIGLVFEGGGRTFGRLTVSENVALPLRYHRNLSEPEVEQELHRIMEPLGLIPYAHNSAKILTLGWQQRVALARALTLNPEILFLDKPLLSIEARHRRWWFDFLPKLFSGTALPGQKPITIVLTTEDVGPWLDIGTHFALLKNNRWQFLGNRAELKNNHDQLKDLRMNEFIL